MRQGSLYTLFFAAVVCGVFSLAVSRLGAVPQGPPGAQQPCWTARRTCSPWRGSPSPGRIFPPTRWRSSSPTDIETRIVNLKTGDYARAWTRPLTTRPQGASRSRAHNATLPPRGHAAKVRRLPNNALVYLVRKEGSLDAVILPMEGKGLWSTHVRIPGPGPGSQDRHRAITFYEHAETPGLGGEVDNPKWKALWVGASAFGDDGAPKIEVIKGTAGHGRERSLSHRRALGCHHHRAGRDPSGPSSGSGMRASSPTSRSAKEDHR